MIQFGNNEIKEVHYNGYTIDKIYACGGELVYSVEIPSYGRKLLLKYTNGDEYSIDCSGQTEDLTINDTTPEGKDYRTVSSATIGECVTYIAPMAFYTFSGLTEVSIPNSVTTIGINAFTVCKSLHTIALPNSLKQLGDSAFKECTNLESVVIPSSVTEIRDEAFNYCTSLTAITCLATTPPTMVGTKRIIDEQVVTTYSQFEYTNNCPIYVPATSVNAYKSATGWDVYTNRIQAIP